MTQDEAKRARLRKLKELQRQVSVEIRTMETDLGVRRRRSRYDPPSCGTPEGYQWHRYQAKKDPDSSTWPLPADDPCGCRAAHSKQRRLRESLQQRPRKAA